LKKTHSLAALACTAEPAQPASCDGAWDWGHTREDRANRFRTA